jgi:hypothetical protein
LAGVKNVIGGGKLTSASSPWVSIAVGMPVFPRRVFTPG